MVWYGMVWYAMVWYGMVWYGVVLVLYGMVWYGMADDERRTTIEIDMANKTKFCHVQGCLWTNARNKSIKIHRDKRESVLKHRERLAAPKICPVQTIDISCAARRRRGGADGTKDFTSL